MNGIKRSIVSAVCFAIMGINGCASIPDVPNIAPAAIDNTTDERALIYSAAAVRGIALTLEAAVDSGQLKGQNARKAKELLDTAWSILKAAQIAHNANDAAKVIRSKLEIQNLVERISGLIPVEVAK